VILPAASKLQALAPPGGIYVGYVSERNLHVDWRQQLKRICLPDGWEYRDANGNPYTVFAAADLESSNESQPSMKTSADKEDAQPTV
jgi:hypothetical protein